MIFTEPGLTWRCTGTEDLNSSGGLMRHYDCVEHPRMTRTVQRASADSPWIERYHVAGIADYFRMPGNALEALRANP